MRSRLLKRVLASIAFRLAKHVSVLRIVQRALSLSQDHKVAVVSKRLARAEAAKGKVSHTTSELIALAFSGVLFALIGLAFMLAISASPTTDSRIFAFAMSMSGCLLLTLLLFRFADIAGALSDVDRIPDSKRLIREHTRPTERDRPPGQYPPANDNT